MAAPRVVTSLVVLALLAPSAGWTAWVPLGPPGAVTETVVIDPRDSTTVYLGVYGGGVWKSADRGSTWAPTGRGPDTVYSIAVDPLTPSTLYAGGYQTVWRSLDAGASWTRINPGLTRGESVYALVIDPAAPSTVYAGAAVFAGPQTGGVLKSTDGGTNWVRFNDGLTDLEVYALAIDPGTPSTLYAGTETGVFKTLDGGGSWAPASAGLSGDVRALAVDSLAPATIYAGTDAGVFKTSDGGASWTDSGAGVITRSVWSVVFDPWVHQTVYAGSRFEGIYRSVDGGVAWTRLADSPVSVQLAIDPDAPATIYAVYEGVFKTVNGGGLWFRSEAGLRSRDLVSVVADPTAPGTFYGSNFHTIYRTADEGATWSRSVVPTSDPFWLALEPRRQTLSFVSNPNPNAAAGYWSRDGGRRWRRSRGLDTTEATSVAADPTDPRIVYAGTFDGIFKSRNGGRRWRLLPGTPAGMSIRGLVVHPLAPDTV